MNYLLNSSMLKNTYSPLSIMLSSSAANRISLTLDGEAHTTITETELRTEISPLWKKFASRLCAACIRNIANRNAAIKKSGHYILLSLKRVSHFFFLHVSWLRSYTTVCTWGIRRVHNTKCGYIYMCTSRIHYIVFKISTGSNLYIKYI